MTDTDHRSSATSDERRTDPIGDRLNAWRAFVAVHDRIASDLEDGISEVAPLGLGEAEVLVTLAHRPDGMRMSELADAVGSSRSGLTRRVDRLEARGLVARIPVPEDRRGAYAIVTARGLEVARELEPRVEEALRRRLDGRLDADEVDELLRILRKLGAG